MGKRRRPLIFIPLIGQTFMSLVGALCAFYWQWPLLPGLIVETIAHGLTGGRLCIMYASQMYTSDIANVKSRTVKMATIEAVQMISVPLGNGVAGFMMTRFGFCASFLLCSAMTIIGIWLGTIFVRDTSLIEANKTVTWWQALSPTITLKSFKVAFRKRPNNKRTIVLLLICIDALLLFPSIGESFSLLTINRNSHQIIKFYNQTSIFY